MLCYEGRRGLVRETEVLLARPSLVDAYELVKKALDQRKFVVLVGQCHVKYDGRASSTLSQGERLIVAKSDGAVLVHRPSGYEPTNWQPSGCSFKTTYVKPHMTITAIRGEPRETLSIVFDSITSLAVYDLKDDGLFSMYVSEEQMKQAILLRPALIDSRIRAIASEKQYGDAGFTDIVAEDSEGNLVVIEIKRTSAGREAVLQLARYLKEINRDAHRPTKGILVAPSLRKGAQTLLASMKLDFRQISPEKCYDVLKDAARTKLSDFFEREDK